jgi:hypothetical protein
VKCQATLFPDQSPGAYGCRPVNQPRPSCCGRCGAAIVDPDLAMSVEGRPLNGRAGPALVPTPLCGDCASELQRFLAAPARLPELVTIPPEILRT